MRAIKKIVKLHQFEGYKAFCLFNNGESRVIDFKSFLESHGVNEKHFAYPLLQDVKEFQKAELIEGSFVWKNIEFRSKNKDGEEVIYPFDIDPIVLYQNSTTDKSRNLDIGLMIKQTRKDLGITQSELAEKIGTTKHYISRIENNKSGIELATLQKITEGLGKRLEITIR
ncbi:MAG: DNA-binding XRE family transcriptional regulator [Saprospiraceae bacterium]|jgi:DNA-binding XRE family transcriptional regulator